MYCIILAGMTGQGKSMFIKKYIQGRACFVFDVQNEYQDLPVSDFAPRGRQIDLNENRFLSTVLRKRNTVCVFEEATGFLEGKTAKELRRAILSKRHSGNVLIFCFHSLSAIPPRIMQMTNYVVLYKTGDEAYQVENKFPSLYPYYLELKKKPNQSFLTIKMIPQ